MFIVHQLPDRKNKQYVVVMDIYFTLVETIIGPSKCYVAVVGTAEAKYVLAGIYIYIYIYHYNSSFVSVVVRFNWPPPEFSKHALHDTRYNTLYYMNDPICNF